MSKFSVYWSRNTVYDHESVCLCIRTQMCLCALLILLQSVADSLLLVFIKDQLYFKGRLS